MRKIIIIVFSLLTLMPGCRKELNTADASLLIGRWKWVKTRYSELINPIAGYNEGFLTPATQGKNYFIEIDKYGMVKFYENDNLVLKRTFRFYHTYRSGGYIHFHFRTSKKANIIFSGNLRGINHDTLYNSDFPYFKAISLNGGAHWNYLVREK